MLVLIDNYDSFTYNLVHYFEEIGKKVKVFRNDEVSIDKIFKMRPEYICIEKSKNHGDLNRFFCTVNIEGLLTGEGWGQSRQKAEKEAAKNALIRINKDK